MDNRSGLRIRRVVLYKHGVAFFERRGKVQGSAVVHLDFKARDMNDVLKSMTVLDLSGGTISAVSYDSTKPLEKLLEEATIRIPEQGSLTALLGQVKGARVRARVGGSLVEGSIVGLESAEVMSGEATATRTFLTLLVDGALRTFDLLELGELTFLDEPVRKDLEFYLSTVLSSYKKDSKRVALFTAGEGERELYTSYTLEAPVWKTSYRVLLDADGKPTMQGWAVVDNTGDEDWEDVALTLIAGLPISFRHDLYSPRYMTRPEVRVQTETSAAPVITEEGFAPPPPAPPPAFGGPPGAVAAGAPMRSRAMAKAAPAPMMQAAAIGEAMERSANVQTVVKDVGDLFEYRVEKPVTVRRNQSALVPILHRKMEGGRVLLYNRENRPKNPLAAIELTNASELTLEGGPLTVAEQELYVGEAMLDTMKPKDRRIVPFAVELSTVVEVEDKNETGNAFKAVLANGVLTTTAWSYKRTRYTFHNKSPRKHTLFAEHAKMGSGWDLVDTPKPDELTERFYRFKLTLEPRSDRELVVTERSTRYQSWQIVDFSRQDVRYYLTSKLIDPKTAGVLEEIVALREQLGELDQEKNRLDEARSTIFEDQQRIRENMGALKAGAEQRQLLERLTKKLDAQETELESVDAELKKLEAQRKKLEAQIANKVGDLKSTKEIGEA
ncbi:MAG: hypothetical protein JST54_12055 [Deltaproteobacteria bacterium]|nr:hypothetical protein [Deltaproteobacteria bacterium]